MKIFLLVVLQMKLVYTRTYMTWELWANFMHLAQRTQITMLFPENRHFLQRMDEVN